MHHASYGIYTYQVIFYLALHLIARPEKNKIDISEKVTTTLAKTLGTLT